MPRTLSCAHASAVGIKPATGQCYSIRSVVLFIPDVGSSCMRRYPCAPCTVGQMQRSPSEAWILCTWMAGSSIAHCAVVVMLRWRACLFLVLGFTSGRRGYFRGRQRRVPTARWPSKRGCLCWLLGQLWLGGLLPARFHLSHVGEAFSKCSIGSPCLVASKRAVRGPGCGPREWYRPRCWRR